MSLRLIVVGVLVAGCVGAAAMDDGPDAAGTPGTPEQRQTFQRCTGRAYTPAADEGWRHDIATPIVTAAGDANHAGKDVIARYGAPAALTAKLAYGAVSKDLEDEDVLVFVDDCSGWRSLGRATTDDDGRVRVAAPMLPVGAYEVRFQVAGDQSVTMSVLWVLPAGTRFVVSDIDATLTTSDGELFEQIFAGLVPPAYPMGAELMAAHAERGHVVMYLTGRPYWLSEMTRDWLGAKRFTPGPLRVTDSNADILPTESSVGAFKRAQLAELVAAGFVIDAAYGNATTDISAYLATGIDPARVWIIGSHAGERGTQPVSESWSARAGEVAASANVAQPFDW
jgi:phosphatidate phosphatase PAH1